MGEPLAVDLLESADGAGELALLDAAGALDPDPPAQGRVPVKPDEVREVVPLPAGPPRERPARVDHRRGELEGPQQQVDRLRHAGLARAGVRILRRAGNEPAADRAQGVELVRGEKPHARGRLRRLGEEPVQPRGRDQRQQAERAARPDERPATDPVAHEAEAIPLAGARSQGAAESRRAGPP